MLQQTHDEPAGSNGRTLGHKRPSLDFRGAKELDWSAIESAIHELSAQSMAVEMIGRSAEENIHGQSLTGTFDFLTEQINNQLTQLWDLLGFKTEEDPRP